jgi:hypothetical protein
LSPEEGGARPCETNPVVKLLQLLIRTGDSATYPT